MKFGLYGLHRGSSIEPDALAARARLAEEPGFESLWVGDGIEQLITSVGETLIGRA